MSWLHETRNKTTTITLYNTMNYNIAPQWMDVYNTYAYTNALIYSATCCLLLCTYVLPDHTILTASSPTNPPRPTRTSGLQRSLPFLPPPRTFSFWHMKRATRFIPLSHMMDFFDIKCSNCKLRCMEKFTSSWSQIIRAVWIGYMQA